MSSQKINNKKATPLENPFKKILPKYAFTGAIEKNKDTFIPQADTLHSGAAESEAISKKIINQSKKSGLVNAHYNNNLRVAVTNWDYNVGYIEVKIAPYLVAAACNVGGGPLEHILKKAMRGADKGHTMNDVYREIICCAEEGIKLNNLLEKGKLCTPNT